MKRKLPALLLALAMAGSMAACSNPQAASTDSEPSSSPSTDNQGGTGSVLDTIQVDNAVYDASEVTPGGVLRIATGNSPTSVGFTPEVSDNGSIQYLRCSYESLLTYDENGALVGQLATNWVTDAEALTITFDLLEGVKFSDGTDFNAEAVVYNVGLYQERSRSEVAFVESVTALSDYQVQFKLSEWNSSALESIGYFVLYMSPSAVEQQGVDWMRTNSCGTGPFVVDSYEQGVSVSYVANENYHVEGQPYLDGIEFTIGSNMQTLQNAFLADEVDVVTGLTDVQVIMDLLDTDGAVFSKNGNGVGRQTTGFITSSADESDPFYDARCRQAFCCAVDWDTLVTQLGYGIYEPTNQWAAPGSAVYNPDVDGGSYNPDRARELLAEAGYADGFETTIYVFPDPLFQNLATAAAAQLAEVGIVAKIEFLDGGTMNAHMTEGWTGVTLHAASLGDLGLYMGRHLDPDGAFYAGGIQHPQDALDLLAAVRSATDDQEKLDLEWELQSLIYDKYALFGKVLYVDPVVQVRQEDVCGGQFGLSHASSWSPATCWIRSE